MCNCSNFVGDDDNGMELEGSHHINADGFYEDDDYGIELEGSHHINADGAFSRETDFNEGGAGSFGFTYDAADGAYSGSDMTLEDDAFDYAGGVSNRRGNASHSSGDGGSWVNEMSDFDGEIENGDDFDNFLTKRSRARRKLRKSLRKENEGMTKKEARKAALSAIPKQSLITTIKNVLKGKPSIETEQLVNAGLLSENPSIQAEQISEAVAENEQEGTQEGAGAGAGLLGDITDDATSGGDTKKAGMFGGKNMMFIGIGAAVLIGGYFMFGKKLGIRG